MDDTLAERLDALATDLIEPLRCLQPAYGIPGRDHCAACCYGTGVVITCKEDQLVVNTADAMRETAKMLRGTST